MLGYGRSVVDTPEVRPDGVFDTSRAAFNSAELHTAVVRHWTVSQSFGVWLIVFVWRRQSTLRSSETLICGDVFSFAAVTVVVVGIWEFKRIWCRTYTSRAPVPRKLQHCHSFWHK
jgi:hypothetical protein